MSIYSYFDDKKCEKIEKIINKLKELLMNFRKNRDYFFKYLIKGISTKIQNKLTIYVHILQNKSLKYADFEELIRTASQKSFLKNPRGGMIIRVEMSNTDNFKKKFSRRDDYQDEHVKDK